MEYQVTPLSSSLLPLLISHALYYTHFYYISYYILKLLQGQELYFAFLQCLILSLRFSNS